MERTLVLVRHGQSEWNEANLFTGWRDVALTSLGIKEAQRAGRALKSHGFHFDLAFTSALRRAKDTCKLILDELGQDDITVVEDVALNERHYGDLCGLNKAEAAERWGEDQVHTWRRSFEATPPGGESLRTTAERVIPFVEERILPEVVSGKSVLVAAHGNSLRSLIMDLEGMSPEQIEELTLATAVPRIYRLNEDGSIAKRYDLKDEE
ncbi:2,3-bisphosphoglycerate-dependent phosphoglycerate mutase [Methyloligella solikamskensis]|uniref:2,3-bisphosphoglycerate-dependent phosphoglycerate mutase n=1 Tax=Methyloligella solikamskensis TaxID=1177756 RepID=A0ABW3J7H2_9HYPH